jgi:hypothetical protein
VFFAKLQKKEHVILPACLPEGVLAGSCPCLCDFSKGMHVRLLPAWFCLPACCVLTPQQLRVFQEASATVAATRAAATQEGGLSAGSGNDAD